MVKMNVSGKGRKYEPTEAGALGRSEWKSSVELSLCKKEQTYEPFGRIRELFLGLALEEGGRGRRDGGTGR